jgi:hypothetical protein
MIFPAKSEMEGRRKHPWRNGYLLGGATIVEANGEEWVMSAGFEP